MSLWQRIGDAIQDWWDEIRGKEKPRPPVEEIKPQPEPQPTPEPTPEPVPVPDPVPVPTPQPALRQFSWVPDATGVTVTIPDRRNPTGFTPWKFHLFSEHARVPLIEERRDKCEVQRIDIAPDNIKAMSMDFQRQKRKSMTGAVIVLWNTMEIFGKQKVAGYTIPDPTKAYHGEGTRNAVLGWEPPR